MTEILDIYDEDGNFLGTKNYEDVHKDGDWHKVVGLFVVNNNKEILMQKRSLKKMISPGLLTVTAGGHIASGEDEFQCLKRESFEELGIVIDVSPATLIYACQDSKSNNGKVDNVFLAGYVLYENIDPETLNYDKDEIENFEKIHYLDLQKRYLQGEQIGVNSKVLAALFKHLDQA